MREKHPTTWETINDSTSSTHYNRRKDTKTLLEYIHGGSNGAVYGAWDFLCRYAPDELLEQFFLERKKGKFFVKLYGKFGNAYKTCSEGMNQAVAEKYQLHLSRRQYISNVKFNVPHLILKHKNGKKNRLITMTVT